MELPRDEDKELVADFILNWSNESRQGVPMLPNTKRGISPLWCTFPGICGTKSRLRK